MGPGGEGRGAGVGEERRGKVSENGVSMEKGEGLGIRLKGRGFEDRERGTRLYRTKTDRQVLRREPRFLTSGGGCG